MCYKHEKKKIHRKQFSLTRIAPYGKQAQNSVDSSFSIMYNYVHIRILIFFVGKRCIVERKILECAVNLNLELSN